MDDGWTKEELMGVALTYGHEVLARKTFDDKDICGVQLCKLARMVANTVMASDLEDMVDPMALGGQKVYDKNAFKKAVAKEAQKEFDTQSEGKQLVARGASKYKLDVFTDQGRRSQMEDKHVCFEDLNSLVGVEDASTPSQAFFAVYDGHGGLDAAEFTAAQLHLQVTNSKKLKDDPAGAMRDGFVSTDKAFLKKAEREGLTSGATACAILIRDKTLHIAWLGDSQAVLCRSGKAVELMKPHKPQNEDEKKRIEDNGGVVVWYGAWRVNGILSVARAIGDRKLKQWVIGEPDVNSFDLDGTEEFMVLACDGLWDVMDNDAVISYVHAYQEEAKTNEGIAESLVRHCIDDLASSDNISCIVVFL
eukprot:m.75746 g.75746  ORF g.75746 m.75746 type:complete len:363 (+) comp24822_c1_seq1:380-1468(+)